MTLDALHTALITGFVATVTGLAVHALTRWRMSKNYVSIETCTAHRRECLLADLGAIRVAIAAIQADITEIQAIQRERTTALATWRTRQERIWRLLLTKLDVDLDRQEELLADHNSWGQVA